MTWNDEVQLETKTSFWNVLAWSMYDLANTIYSMVIVSLIINQYVLIIGQKEYGMSYAQADAVYNIVTAVMQVFIAISMPIAGALSDTVGKRKPFVIVLTGIILLFASLLGVTHSLWLVLLFYVIANMSYQISLAFYDAQLAFIANPKDAGKVGGFGVAFGYLGTIVGILVMMQLQNLWGSPVSNAETIEELNYGYYGKWASPAIAMGLFFVFALPYFFLKERQKEGKRPPAIVLLKQSFKQLGNTFRDIRSHKEMFKFIIGYFLVVEVANIIVLKMFLIVRDGMRMSSSFGMIFIVLSTVSAVLFTYFIGVIADKKGAKAAFLFVGLLWSIAIIMGIYAILILSPIPTPDPLTDFSQWTWEFIFVLIMGFIAGPALGGTWVAQRAMVVELAPKEKFGEYFGFSKLSGKVSSSLGPLIWSAAFSAYLAWGDIPLTFEAYAVSMLTIGLIMVIGLIIIFTVKPAKYIKKEVEKIEKIE